MIRVCGYVFFFQAWLTAVPGVFFFFLAVFSNMLKDTQIHILADSDELEVVQQVQVT